MSILSVSNLEKSLMFEENGADSIHIKDINFELNQGQILALLGPSGCGKTTLLRMVAGLESPDAGEVHFDGNVMNRVPVHRRNFGMMFQEFALFPHRNVRDNVAFGLQIKKLNPADIRKQVNDMLDLVGLSDKGDRRVDELSGGERQRVALARSLAPKPRLLMLDEPLGSLDRELRERLLPELRQILNAVNVTVIFVTHDHSEAFAIADKIAVMHKGEVQQIDNPERLYREPQNSIVASFLGFRNLLEGRLKSDNVFQSTEGQFQILNKSVSSNGNWKLLIRPESARIINQTIKDDSQINCLSGELIDRLFQGAVYRLRIRLKNDREFVFDVPVNQHPPESGSRINLQIDPGGLHLLET